MTSTVTQPPVQMEYRQLFINNSKKKLVYPIKKICRTSLDTGKTTETIIQSIITPALTKPFDKNL